MANELRVNIVGDASKLSASLKTASSKLSAFGKRVSNIGSSLSTRLTLPLAIAGGAAIKLASDFEESLNKVNVAFGKSSGFVRDFAKTTLTQFGIAEGSALDMAALFGDMATSMGISRKEAASMSTSMVGLAGDLASFKNIGIDQATTALAGVFTGETESLKRLGIVMTESNLQMFAMSQNIQKNVKDMTQAEKVNLRYQFILSKTNNAQGDFARTQDGAANQMRIFTEGSKQLGQSLGTILLPAFTKIVTKLNTLVTDFINLDNETKSLVISIAAFAAGIGPALFIVGKLATAIGLLATPIGLVVTGLGAIVFIISKNFDEILPVVVKLVNRFIDLFNQSELLRGTIAGIKTAFKIAFIAIKSQIDQAINVFSTFSNLIVEFADKGIAGEFGKVISDGFEAGEDIAKKAGEDIGKAMADGVNETLNKRLEHISESGIKTSLSKLKNSLNIFGSSGGASSGGDKEQQKLGGIGVGSVGMDPIALLANSIKNVGNPALRQSLDETQLLMSEKQMQFKANANQFNDELTVIFEQGLENLAIGIGEALGSAISTGGNLGQQLGAVLLGSLGGIATQVGKMAIGIGIALEKIKIGLTNLNPAVAIAAGIALIALGSIFKSQSSKIASGMGGGKAPAKFASGGIVSAPTMGLVGEYPGAKSNPEVIAPLDKLKGMIGDRGSSKVEVGGSFTLKGQDLVVALQRANSNRNRIL